MLNTDLTAEELTDIKARFAVVQKLQKIAHERTEAFQALPQETGKDLADALAHSVVTTSLMEVIREWTDQLGKDLGVDLDEDANYAEVISILDGNRRVGKR